MTRTTQPPRHPSRKTVPIPARLAVPAMAIAVAFTAGTAIYSLTQPAPIVIELAPGETAGAEVDTFIHQQQGAADPV